MQPFLEQNADRVAGVLSGCDWILFRGRALRILVSGEFHVQRVRNREIARALHGHSRQSSLQRRRTSSRITRLLRQFCAHGLIRKVPRRFRSRVTRQGQHLMTPALSLQEFNLTQLAA